MLPSALTPRRSPPASTPARMRPPDGGVVGLVVGATACAAGLGVWRGRGVKGRWAHLAYAPAVAPGGGAQLDPTLLSEPLCPAIEGGLKGDPPHIRAVAT